MFIKVKDNYNCDVYLNLNQVKAIHQMKPVNIDGAIHYSIIYGDAEDAYVNISEDEFNKIPNLFQ